MRTFLSLLAIAMAVPAAGMGVASLRPVPKSPLLFQVLRLPDDPFLELMRPLSWRDA